MKHTDKGINVKVVDGNVEKAIKKFNKKVKKAGLMERLFEVQYFEKPSVKKHRKNKIAKYKAKTLKKE